MSQYKISKARLKEIIKEEYEAAMARTDEAHCGTANRDEEDAKPDFLDLDKDGDKEESMKKAAKDKKLKKEYAGDWTKAIMTGDARDAYDIPKIDDDEEEDDKKKKKKKKMNKESLDSIRALIQQELKNL